jgi:hypothetical protein
MEAKMRTDVTPASITQDRRGNMPPPSGGIGSF